MKKIKCINASNFKITEGQEYEAIKESQDFYFLVNDAGNTVKYGKSYFEKVVEAPARTEQDMIDSISINTDGHFSFIDLNENRIAVSENIRTVFGFNESNIISCGVGQITTINSILQNIGASIPDDDDYIELRKALLRKALEYLKNKTSKAMWLVSTNINNNEYLEEEDVQVLDEMAHVVTERRINPNSNNLIKVWIFTTRDN